MGLLDTLFGARQPAGLLGQPMAINQYGGAQQQPTGGLLGGFGGFLRNNPNMLIQLGSAIGGNAGFSNALKAIGETVPQARTLDQQMAEKRAALAEQASRRQAITKFLKARQGGAGQALDPDTMALMEAYPDLAEQYVGDIIAPKPAGYDFFTSEGRAFVGDKGTGDVRTAFEPPAEPPKPTSDIQNYEYYVQQERAAGREPLGPLEFEQAVRQSGATRIENNVGPTGVDYGDPGPGLAWRRNPDNTVMTDEQGLPIAGAFQGGKVAQEAAAAEAKAVIGAGQKERTANIVVDEVDRALARIESNPSGTTGWGGLFMQWAPESDAQFVKERMTTIKANVGFDKLQLMRESSPTGGAVGQVSNFENVLLQATFGSLEQSQRPEDLSYNLRRIGSIYSIVIGEPGMEQQTQALAQIGQAVDRGEMSQEEAMQQVEGILSTVPDSGWTALPGGARMREIK